MWDKTTYPSSPWESKKKTWLAPLSSPAATPADIEEDVHRGLYKLGFPSGGWRYAELELVLGASEQHLV
jgi:hypothetical protein